MKFFSVDGGLYKFFSRLWDILRLNFIWLVCSLPIITIGASTIAAYTITLKMIDNEEGYVIKPFLKAFKDNFKQGMIIGPVSILFIASVVVDFIIGGTRVGFFALGLVATFIFVFMLIFAYPLLARYENTVFQTLKNSFRISMKFFPRTLGMIIVMALEIAVFLWSGITQIMGILIAPACLMLTVSGFAMSFFRQIEKDNKAE